MSALRAILHVVDSGSGELQSRDNLYHKMAGVEDQILSPGLDFSLELGGCVRLGSQPIHIDQARFASDAGCYV